MSATSARPIAASCGSSGVSAADWLLQFRPYLAFVSGVTGLTGLALAPEVPAGLALVVGAAFFLSYGFGQILTDCFQLDTDAISAPYRPLVRGRLPRRTALLGSLAGLLGCGAVFALADLRTIPLVLLCVGGLASYTPMKRRWWAGPPWNAAVVALLVLIGWTCGGGPGSGTGSALPLAVAAAFFGYADFVVTGYFKDVEADRQTGYRTIAVAHGRGTAATVSGLSGTLGLAAGLAAILVLAGGATAGGSTPSLLTWLAAAGASVLGHRRLRGVREDRDAYRAVSPVVVSYVLLLTSIGLAARPDWGLPLLAAAAAFPLALAGRPDRAQV